MGGLPYGRGYAKGEDAWRSKEKDFEDRRLRQPKEDGWVVAASQNPSYGSVQNACITDDDTLYLIRLPVMAETHTFKEARLRCVIAGASESVYAGIYVYQPEPTRAFTLIAGSDVTFPLDTAGLLTKPLRKELRMVAGQRYFIGTISTDTLSVVTAAFAGDSGGGLEAVRTVSALTLPKKVELSTTTASYPVKVPLATYVSEAGAEVI